MELLHKEIHGKAILSHPLKAIPGEAGASISSYG
jgi:hypothetical protein